MKFTTTQFKKGTYKDAEIKIVIKYPIIWFSKTWCPNFRYIGLHMRWKDKLYSLCLYTKIFKYTVKK